MVNSCRILQSMGNSCSTLTYGRFLPQVSPAVRPVSFSECSMSLELSAFESDSLSEFSLEPPAHSR